MNSESTFSRYISITRVIAALILSPLIGLLIYFLFVSVPEPFSFETFNRAFLGTVTYFSVIMSKGSALFFPLSIITGAVVMLLLLHYYDCNIGVCLIGAITNAVIASLIFLFLLLAAGAELLPALAGFSLLLALISLPSVIAGVFFWILAVYRNTSFTATADHEIDVPERAF
ncbi:MAG: hypothetical protein ABFR82_09615 [Nitrospirota bacterium]